MALTKFLDPKNDFAFKRIFGTERNQDILIQFLNDMLSFTGDRAIRAVSYLQTSQDPEIASKKQSLIDVLCADEQGRQYIVEMQVARTPGFEKRAQYYAAKAYSRQLRQGEKYHQLKEIIFLAITDFVMFPDKAAYQSNHGILDKETYSQDLQDFHFTFLELPKFNKSLHQLENRVEKWTYFFKHAEATAETDLCKIIGNDTIIQRAYDELNRFVWSEVELNTYEQEEKRERDAQAIIDQRMLDIAAAEAKLEISRTQVATAKIEIAMAETEIKTAKTEIATAKSEIESAKIEIATAKTELATAKTEIESAKTEMEVTKKSYLYQGKMEGIVEGQLAALKIIAMKAYRAGLPLLTIQELTGLSEAELSKIQKELLND